MILFTEINGHPLFQEHKYEVMQGTDWNGYFIPLRNQLYIPLLPSGAGSGVAGTQFGISECPQS